MQLRAEQRNAASLGRYACAQITSSCGMRTVCLPRVIVTTATNSATYARTRRGRNAGRHSA